MRSHRHFFFFSSRRRHTRLQGDWSSDVCSSNLMHDATMLFIPTDDVWASVIVEGNAPRATLQARWLTDGGGVLEQSSQEITPTGRTVVAFHAAARPGGWPLGRYKLELLLDGVVGGTQPFEIRRPPL